MTIEAGPSMAGILRRHLQPTLDMLSNAIRSCPDEAWDAADETVPIWQQAYHTLFWLNAWLRDWNRPFEPPPFHTDEARDLVRGAAPVLTRSQIEEYMAQVYLACQAYLDALPADSLTEETEAFGQKWTVADRVLGQIRHVQHHVGSMHSLLRRKVGKAPGWQGYNE